MIPKTIHLEYPLNFRPDGNPHALLPAIVHLRGATVLATKYNEGQLIQTTLKSEYDALQDIYIEMDMLGDIGIVKTVWFEDSK